MPAAVLSAQCKVASAPSRTHRGAAAASSSQTPDELLDQVTALIPQTFQQAQTSLAVHRKLIVALSALHKRVADLTHETPKGTKLVGEKAFNDVFIACINRVLAVKKGEAVADRCLKFVAAYVACVQGVFRKQAQQVAEDEDEEEEEDTTATRFAEILVNHCLRGFLAKNKNVRLRCCQLVALLVNDLESMDDDLFERLKALLLERTNDKEAPVRVQAIIALAKLQQSSGEGEEGGADGDEVRDTIVWLLRHDASAEVRRAALFNLSLTRENFPYILERLRDVDVINRRCVFLGSLAMLPALAAGSSSAAGRLLDAQATTEAIGLGLKDREESVRRATKKLMTTWTDAVSGDLEAFLARFDLLTSDVGGQALACMLEQKPALLDHVPLTGVDARDTDEFWNSLDPARALLAQVYLDHLREKTRDVQRWEDAMPPVTALAFRIQKHFNAMINVADEGGENAEDAVRSDAFRSEERIVASLLQIALHADYADEIGRRKMFSLVREMLSTQSHAILLSEQLLAHSLDLLLKLSNGQRDFMRIVVEITQELEDGGEADGEDDFVDATQDASQADSTINAPAARKKGRSVSGRSARSNEDEEDEEKKAQRDARRLMMVRAMLERVGGTFHENTAFHGLIPQLIAPAVRSKDAQVREQGLTCLGLSCLLDKKLALETFPLFLDQIQRGADAVKLCAVQLVFDLILVHGIPYLASRNIGAREEMGAEEFEAKSKEAFSQIMTFLLAQLEDEDEAVQAAAALGVSKLLLAGVIPGEEGGSEGNPTDAAEVLKSLVLVYLSPETAANEELRQCLSYVLPAYCYSSPSHQRLLKSVWLEALRVLCDVYADRDDASDMVAPPQIAAQLIDWMDATKAIYPGSRDTALNADVAIDVLRAVLAADTNAGGDGLGEEERKLFIGLLSKATLPDEVDEIRAHTILILCDVLRRKPSLFTTTALANSFSRFHTNVLKKYADAVDEEDDGSGMVKRLEMPEYAHVKTFLEQTVRLDITRDLGGAPPKRPAPRTKCAKTTMGKTVKTTTARAAGSGGGKSRSPAAREEEDEEEEDMSVADTESVAADEYEVDEDEFENM